MRCTAILRQMIVAVVVALSALLAGGVDARAAAATSAWTWPLPGRPPVLRPFQPPPTPYAAGHRGVDLGAPIGTPVRAAGAGVVSFAGPLAGRGVVTVTHGALRTTYEPVAAVVRRGQPVTLGEQIGWLAAPTGHCGIGVPCLHWGLLRGATYLDPLLLLGAAPVRLLPLYREIPTTDRGVPMRAVPAPLDTTGSPPDHIEATWPPSRQPRIAPPTPAVTGLPPPANRTVPAVALVGVLAMAAGVALRR